MSSHVFTEFMWKSYTLNHVSSAWNYLDIYPWLPLPSPRAWVPPWLALSPPSQAPEKDRSHDVSQDLGLFNKPCRQSTQLAYGSRLLLPHETLTLRNKSAGSWKNLELQIQLFTSIYCRQLVQQQPFVSFMQNSISKAWSLTHIGPLPLVLPWLAPLFRPFQGPAKLEEVFRAIIKGNRGGNERNRNSILVACV